MKQLLLLLLLFGFFKGQAQAPQLINYQGVARNSVGSVIANQNISLRLSIRDGSPTGEIIYRESRALRTNNFGLFVTAIGSSGATNVTGSFSIISWGNGTKFLQVEIDPAGAANFIDMGTSQLLSVPYAMYATTAGTALPTGNAGGDLTGEYPSPLIKDGAITNSKISDGEITASKLQAGLIPTSLPPNGNAGGDLTGTYPSPSIKAGIINNSKLADNAVGTSKIQNGSVTAIKLAPGLIPTSLPPMGDAGGDLSGTYPNPTIGSGVITGDKIAAGTITADKLAPGVIPSSLPMNGTAGGDLTGSYPNPGIAAGVIDNTKLANNSVTNTKLADNSVTSTKILDGSVTSSKLAAGVIPTTLPPSGLASGDLSGNYPNPTVNKLQGIGVSNTVPTNGQVLKFNGTSWVPATDNTGVSGAAGGDLTGTYPNPTINALAVDNTKLGDNSVSTSKLQDASVTALKIAAGVIPTTLPPSGAAGGDLSGTYPNPTIANNAITNQKLADGSITTTKIGDNQISTSKIQDGAITASKLDPSLLIVGGGGSPTGTAGGDLGGNYPNPSVNKIQGVGVSNTAPATGQVLKFNGTSWVPGIDNVGVLGGTAGGDLTGTYPNPTIADNVINSNNLKNNAVTTNAIANKAVTTQKLDDGAVTYSKISTVGVSAGQVLKFDGVSWAPGIDNVSSGGGAPSGAAGGDLTGTYPNPIVANNAITTGKLADGSVTSAKLAVGVIPTSLPPSGTASGDLSGTYPSPVVASNAITTSKLADNSITTLKVADGSITSSKLASGVIPTTLPPSGLAGGDLNGNYPNPTVNKIQGIGISNTVPTNGQVLTFNGTQWIASTPSGGSSLSLPYTSAVNSSSNLFSLTNSGSGAGLEGVNSTTSSNVSGIIGRISATTPGTMSAGIKGINNGTGANGIGVYGTHAGGGYGVYGSSVTGTGVYGNSPSGFAVMGSSVSGTAVYGQSSGGNAGAFYVSDATNSNDALFVNNFGQGNAISALSDQSNGIFTATNSGSFAGIQAMNNGGGIGVWGVSTIGTGSGVKGTSADNGGAAIEGELLGVTTGNLAVFKVDGTNKARINEAGKGFFNGGTQNSGADVAETFDVEGNRREYEPGDVLTISRSSDRTVEKSQSPYSTLVAGVYATRPGVLLTEKDASADKLDDMVPMGVIGVIPTKVCMEGGAIKRGDLLVTSSIAGTAMKADPDKVKVGQVIGKALEDYNLNGVGKIKVLVSIK